HEPERGWTAEAEGARDGGQLADVLAVARERRARRRHRALEHERLEPTVHVAARRPARDDLLSEVAALSLADRRLDGHLERERRLAHVEPDARDAELDAPALERIHPARARAGGDDGVPDARHLGGRRVDGDALRAELPRANDAHRDAGDRALDVRERRERRDV